MLSKIKDLKITGFRGLPSLQIDGLDDVNLFVGKNNTGKTTVLEALRLLLSGDPRARLWELLSSREEFSFSTRRTFGASGAVRGQPLAYDALFYGRPSLEDGPSFSISANHHRFTLAVQFSWLRREFSAEDAGVRYLLNEEGEPDSEAVPGLQIHTHESRILLPFDRLNRMYAQRRLAEEVEPSLVFLPSSGMDILEVGRIWDTIALTDEEDDVIDALRIIAPSLEKLVMVQAPESRSRMLMAKLGEFRNPVPFKSLGEGTVHILGVILALMKARGGIALFDEVENGVHYSIQGELWDIIFRQAKKLKVQVFATTHSWDSIEGFNIGGRSNRKITGALFRLERFYDIIKSTRFSVDEVSIADRESIEIR